MSRYIDADALIKWINGTECFMDVFKRVTTDIINKQPTVDAVPVVHGHWEIVPNDENTDGYYKMRCSVCGEILWSIQSEELYCCKCGAKMDEWLTEKGERMNSKRKGRSVSAK